MFGDIDGLTEYYTTISEREGGLLCMYVQEDLLVELLWRDLDSFIGDVMAVGRRTDNIHCRGFDTHDGEKFGDGDRRKSCG